ncbi:MAG TPA: hypothetical protein VN620_15490, partial [Candidatus Methylomirabilis sp.]|nr:hypothetical protein [Candidatus Methylomirabilis sp.]
RIAVAFGIRRWSRDLPRLHRMEIEQKESDGLLGGYGIGIDQRLPSLISTSVTSTLRKPYSGRETAPELVRTCRLSKRLSASASSFGPCASDLLDGVSCTVNG